MGTSGAMSTSNQYVKYSVSIGTNWQSVGENYSSVNVQVRFWRTNSGYQTYGSGTVYCKINGTTYSASVSSSQKITNSGITLFNRDVAVGHNADGSKYLDTSAWININAPLSSSEQWYGEWISTIPRASQPTLSSTSVTMGNSVTVYTNRASGDFTHSLYYQIGGSGWNTIATNIGDNYTWTIPTNLANNTPNSTNLNLTMILETYSGSTYIGSKTVTLTANVPSNFVPIINSVTLSETVSGISSKFGGYVQSKSKIKGIVSASGAYSSTINKYQSNTNSQTFNSSIFTTNEIINDGNQSISTTVTDSRGRTESKTTNYTVIPYSNPTITVFTVARANSNGQIDDRGSYVLCAINASISSVNNKNNKSFILKWSAIGESEQTVDLTPESGYIFNSTYLASGINVDKEYTFTLSVTDYFVATSQTKQIPTAFTLVDYNASGKSLAFGQVSTASANESKMQIKMDVDLEGNLKINNKTIFDLVYPIGSIYMSVNSVNPQNLFGGTWVQWGSGRVPVCVNPNNGNFNYAEKMGGEEYHMLSTYEMPSHGGHVPNASYAWGDAGEATYVLDRNSGAVFQHATNRPYVLRVGNEMCLRSNYEGGNGAHNNLQPYITCYMWKRTA